MYSSRFFDVAFLDSVDLRFSVASIVQRSKINRLTITSLILRNRCKMSGTTWSMGMAGNSGHCMQPYFNPRYFLELVFVFPQLFEHHLL